jgi:hypothetical protein
VLSYILDREDRVSLVEGAVVMNFAQQLEEQRSWENMVQEQRVRKRVRQRQKTVDARGFLLGMSPREQGTMIANRIKVFKILTVECVEERVWNLNS